MIERFGFLTDAMMESTVAEQKTRELVNLYRVDIESDLVVEFPFIAKCSLTKADNCLGSCSHSCLSKSWLAHFEIDLLYFSCRHAHQSWTLMRKLTIFFLPYNSKKQ